MNARALSEHIRETEEIEDTMMNNEALKHRNSGEEVHEAHVRALERLSAALRGLRFGVVTAVVHDGVVVSIERTEKLRLPNGSGPHERDR